MQKVSMWNAAEKALSLFKARFKYFLVYGVLILAANIVRAFMEGRLEGGENELALGVSIVSAILLSALTMSQQHFSIASCRRQTSFFPAKPLRSFVKYILASLVLALIAVLAVAVVVIPVMGAIQLGLSSGNAALQGGVSRFGSLILLLLVAGSILVPLVRFGAVLPAISIGDSGSFARSWRLTKGHSLRLVASLFCFVFLPFIALFVMLGLAMAEGGAKEAGAVAINLLLLLLVVFSAWLMPVFYGIVYDDLKNRYEAMTSEGEFELSERSAASPAAPSQD